MFRITTLIENSRLDESLSMEHGLSIHISDGKHSILFDTGASGKFIANAKKLGVDMGNIDAMVLSHGHYDHTGGVKSLLGPFAVPKAAYVGKGFFDPRFTQDDEVMTFIGAPLTEGSFYTGGVPLHVLSSPIYQLFEHVYLIGGFSREIKFEPQDPSLLRYRNGNYEVDSFGDEIALVLERENDLVVISGCAHVGVGNTCGAASQRLGKPIYAYIGGTHLMESGEERIQQTAEYLEEHGVQVIGACHCTGDCAAAYFAENYPGYYQNSAGSVIEL